MKDLQRFRTFTLGCPKPGCCPPTKPLVMDSRTNKIIIECMDEETANMTCMALNMAQNEGLL
jgi:hypothetical protein